MNPVEVYRELYRCKCRGFVSGSSTSYASCLDCQHGLYYHSDGPCRHSDEPEAKIVPMRDMRDK